MDINYISKKQSEEFINNWLSGNTLPLEKYISCYGTNPYVAIDNSTNECWTEEFKTKEGCERYLLYFEDVEEVRAWEENRLRKIEISIYGVYYLLIFSMILVLFYLLRI